MVKFKISLCFLVLALAPMSVFAQTSMAAAPAPVASPVTAGSISVTDPVKAPVAAVVPATPVTTIGTSAPVAGIGQPVEGGYTIQPQVTKLGEQALWMHNAILMPMMVIISFFVLGLLFWIVARFRRSANPVASKTSHNTFIEVVWTLIPILILVGISIPSISLLAAQYKPAPAGAVTLKATGNQWYWSYEYPDYGIDLTANMLTDEQAAAKGEPRQLGVDNRVVLPVGTPIKLITTAADVIHSWAMPAFWIKMDSVPGRLNETSFTVEKEGVYYGQCSELCGDRHGFMPIGVEVVSKEKFAQWVRAKGGKMPGDKAVAIATPVAAPSAIPVVAKN